MSSANEAPVKRPPNQLVWFCLLADSFFAAAGVAAVFAILDLATQSDETALGQGGLALGVFLLWLLLLVASDGQNPNLILAGTDYYSRTLSATSSTFVIATVFADAIGFNESTRLLIVGVPIGIVTIIPGRWLFRQAVRSSASGGGAWFRTLYIEGGGSRSISGLPSDLVGVSDVGSVSATSVAEIVDAARESNADLVVLGSGNSLDNDGIQQLSWTLNSIGVALWVQTYFPSMRTGRFSIVPSRDASLVFVDATHMRFLDRVVKRLLDLTFGVVLIVIFLPVFVVAGLAIAISDGRPILYRQTRVGKKSKTFTLVKFRTMEADSEDQSVETTDDLAGTKSRTDPRITKVGQLLRRWSLDELPQLWLVINGKMSLVGPRPRLPNELNDSPLSTRRLEARPGMTGLWQVSGRADLSWNEADALDIMYVDNWTLTGDIVILIRTFKAVLSRRGAY